jgi:hypothetical protein
MDENSSDSFGFTVRSHSERSDLVSKDGRATSVRRKLDPPHWQVHLPHQCDNWEIIGGDYSGASQAEAVAELERFIAEAQQALVALREGREFGDAD